MPQFLRTALVALATLVTLAAVPPQPAFAQNEPHGAEARLAALLNEVSTLYDSADAARYVNDASGRLIIYREAVRRMETADSEVRALPRYHRNHLFYQIAVATTLRDAGQADADAVHREIDRLLPPVRAFVAATPSDLSMTDGLARLLTAKGQLLATAGNNADALPLARETLRLSQQLLEAYPPHLRSYQQRAVAINLDNLANLEAELGNAAEANSASAQALDLFRELARQSPDSRPAQGSLLIALFRRAMNFGELAALDEAERQISLMRERNMLTDRYQSIVNSLPGVRARLVRSANR